MNHSKEKSPRRQQRRARARQPKRHTGPAANARANYEHYSTLARESLQGGDSVETENWLQYADHYFRMMKDPAS